MSIRESVGRSLVHRRTASGVSDALVGIGAYRIRDMHEADDWYTWKSGIRAPCYCNCRELMGHPKERSYVTRALIDAIEAHFPGVDLIVGMATAGISWAAVAAEGLSLPFAYVRTSAKDHGVEGLVVGAPTPGARALLVDDLVASGGSVSSAIRALHDETAINVEGVLSIVNWGFPKMRANLEGLKVRALCSYPDILDEAFYQEKIDEAERAELAHFYRDPKSHVWASRS